MDSISIETPAEARWVKELIDKEDLHYIWTGGRKCNFRGINIFVRKIKLRVSPNQDVTVKTSSPR